MEPEAFPQVSLAEEMDTAIAEAVKGLRACGYSWADIGRPPRHHPSGGAAALAATVSAPVS